MSAAQWLGAFLIALPFLAVAVGLAIFGGWRAVMIVFGGTAILVAIITLGSMLVTGELQ